jgi:hypothetical protein
VDDYLAHTQPQKLFNSHFLSKPDKPPVKLESVTIK